MKRQFLGDAKDAFKWDYLDFLTRELGIQFLNILLMLTPDKNNRDGKTPPDGFPASQEILEFCKKLQKVQGGSDSNILNLLRDLPKCTNADYAVKLHKECEDFAALHTKGTRGNYFRELYTMCHRFRADSSGAGEVICSEIRRHANYKAPDLISLSYLALMRSRRLSNC